jgi:hypothetical protein
VLDRFEPPVPAGASSGPGVNSGLGSLDQVLSYLDNENSA